MSLQGAILDDYQYVAMKVADWSPIAKDVSFKVFTEALGGPRQGDRRAQGLRRGLPDARAHAVRRRRHRRPARAQADRHQRHAQRRHRRGRRRRARHPGLRHRIARQPDRGTHHRPDHRARPQDRHRKRAAESRRALAGDARHRPLRQDARHHRAGQARHARGAGRQCARHESDRLEPEPHRRKSQGRRRHAGHEGGTAAAIAISSPCMCSCRRAPRA